ncbi:hypothetical protein CHS0354_020001 [Potamilus streckersoni]|uniref:Uncharacterized protein n=1 Tax=Potamilus streckersoni TaxID=2493646 RepID=A0AAE0SY51_9BIVA|nr:hypothetical protein CHS0354_020001 [Potamilus streckersoni]
MGLLKDEVDEVMMVWNTHIIRANRNNTPSGRPLILHLLPDMENVEDHLCDVSEEEIDVCRMECSEETIYHCEEELFELCCLHMEENNWTLPKAITEAIDLYLRLRNWLLTQL